MRVAYVNKIDDIAASALTPLSTIAGYSISNVQDQRLTKAYKSDSATTQTVVVNFGAATAVTVIAIMGHNIASTATVLVEGNATDSWGSPSVSETITYNEDIMMKFISTQSYQYWRFAFSGLTESLSVGRLWLGEYSTIDPSSTLGLSVSIKRDDTVVYGRGRQKYASIGAQWRAIDVSFPPTSTTTLSIIQDLYETVGNHSSFIFCNFDDLRTYPLVEPLYGSLVGTLDFTHDKRMRFTYGLTIEEDL
jgi:hypothetical protein